MIQGIEESQVPFFGFRPLSGTCSVLSIRWRKYCILDKNHLLAIPNCCLALGHLQLGELGFYLAHQLTGRALNISGAFINWDDKPVPDIDNVQSDNDDHLLVYEDKEGDWLVVGDVPWQ
ncbi:hypothetical protein IFM89_019323 [Coptis chinensis]|uniref:Auxin-responsive protein n=1 Tax=Coptis chinensis TaxID=261450 RepID=A0A835M8H5_9MAGN|nr:hypothetical protein IFM89_019323 [Coptis chinensis]